MGNYVRCVRGDSCGVNEFVNNGDGTITDNATGLMWQKADSGQRYYNYVRLVRDAE